MKITGLIGEYETIEATANATQVGGDHYRKYGDLQPWDVWVPWNLNGFQCNIIKYTVRYKDKDGIKDLEKARHYLEKLIEVEKANAQALSKDSETGQEDVPSHLHVELPV